MMKKIIPILFIILNITLAGPADRILAFVGDDIILESELQEALDFVKIQSGTSLIVDSNLTQQVLDRLIEDRLILEEARQETVFVTKAEIEDELENSISALKSRFATIEEFEKALIEEGLTERALRQRYRDEIRKRLTAQKLLAKKGLTNIYIAPSEAERFYQEKKDSIAYVPGAVALAHILFRVIPDQAAEQKAQIRSLEIYDILMRGGDFEEVARSFSEDERTRQRGGLLGELRKGELFEAVESVLFILKPGDISPPLRSPMGYQIFQILSKTKNTVKANHILVKIPITRADTLKVEKLAQTIRKQLLTGAKFDSFAGIYSEDPETRDQGGFLGQFLIKGLMPPFNTVVEKMQAEEISQPIRSEHGIHLIKVIVKEEERLLSFEEMQDQIRNYLYQERLAAKLKDYLARVAARTFITKKI